MQFPDTLIWAGWAVQTWFDLELPQVLIGAADIMLVLLRSLMRLLFGSPPKGQKVATQPPATIQDAFLKHLRDNKLDVTMFLVNGIRLQGQIRQFDNFTVLLVRGSGTQVVYKHAISAIYPAEPV